MTAITEFLDKVRAVYNTGAATEHSYRSAIETLIGTFGDNITALNEPKRVKCGAPDFIVQHNEIVIGHIEAKDLNVGLRNMREPNKNQQQRYLNALPNLIYTNCLDWDFYRDGKLIASVSIADFLMGIQDKTEAFENLDNLLQDFVEQRPISITTPKDLAQRMAGKAVLIKDVLFNALNDDDEGETELDQQFTAFGEHLIHDISKEYFADIYAETIAYGMFAARLHDPTIGTFSRQEALDLLPKSNPFLRNLFGYVAGQNLDERIKWIIDDLAAVFRAANVAEIMEGFGKLSGRNDPFLHFYETFLSAYNPDKRKSRGVWYTPEAVVRFIVNAVDEVLRTEFDIKDGLADTSKVTITRDTGQRNMTKKGKLTKDGKNAEYEQDVHRVQILDPAVGTGTFPAEVIKKISETVEGVGSGIWSSYVENDLIPRLHGFELLMASYAMCHMKLDMILTELGYMPTQRPPRLSVYLTNSLEEGEPVDQTLPFANWLTAEAREANIIKRELPIMCILGNPPYSGESSNKSEWIMELMEDYKKEPGGTARLQEKNSKWINDDYVKFIRMSESLIEKNKRGVLAFITNHSYLDNPTFRGMRWHLKKTFDKIYILDLHGNSKKQEKTPSGGSDKNVFDIQQGVAIFVGIKTSDSSELAELFQADIWGTRKAKYEALLASSLYSKNLFSSLESRGPLHLLVPHDSAEDDEYNSGFALDEFMPTNSVGIVTARDALTIAYSKDKILDRAIEFRDLDVELARTTFRLNKDVQDWSIADAQADLRATDIEEHVTEIAYRPFDKRWTVYTGKSKGFHCRPRAETMRNFLNVENLGLCVSAQQKTENGFHHVLIQDCISESCLTSNKTSEIGTTFPLFIYPNDGDLDRERRVNFDEKLWDRLKALSEKPDGSQASAVDTLDYIYGVLHDPIYRQRFRNLLKRGLPRIPWPNSSNDFWQVVDLGCRLRKLHLMDNDAVGDTPYPLEVVAGTVGPCVVEKFKFVEDKVYINAGYYFDKVPREAWDFYIGSYQPAQKWLKDRKGQILSYDDIRHYQKIIKVLAETISIIK